MWNKWGLICNGERSSVENLRVGVEEDDLPADSQGDERAVPRDLQSTDGVGELFPKQDSQEVKR